MKTALVIGATGLVGSELVKQLLDHDKFGKVVVFARRSTGLQHQKLEEHIIDFNKPDTWKHLVKGDVVFSALGTTLKQAGSKDAQYQIDYTYQYQFAAAGAENGVPVYVLVSSAGADTKSRIFYSRIKGELERDVKQLSFTAIHILQPSLLVGDRKEERKDEKIGYVLLNGLNKIGLFKKYKPIHDSIVAKAMINASLWGKSGVHISILEEVFTLASGEV
jgi:uncharacterized protein YbjT (DUF2867 family)